MHFLFVTWDGGGNIPPTVTIATRLIDRGHSVRVLGPRSLQPRVEAAGGAFTGYERVPNGVPSSAGTARMGRARAAFLAPELARAAPARAFAEDVLAELGRRPSDVLVVDFMLAGAIAAGERAGVPTAALMHTAYCLPASGRPPFGPALRAWRGRHGQLRDTAVSMLVRHMKRHALSDLDEARRCIGLSRVASASQQFERVNRVLVLTSEEFDLPGPLLPNVRYVGPQFDESWRTERPQLPFSTDAREPLVVVSFSSRFAARGIVQRVLDALGDLPVRALLTLGPALAGDGLRIPANVVVRQFLPHGALLPCARVVITHAGLGTVMAALAHGVPLVCVPLKNDQFENAARVVAAGAGRALSRRVTRRSLQRAILDVLVEPRFTEGARRMANCIAAARTESAVDELEALAHAADGARGTR